MKAMKEADSGRRLAIRQASTMNAMKEADNSVVSDVRASTSSQTTASEGSPAAASSAWSKASEIAVSMVSIAIDPTCGICSSFRSSRITLASSLATSHRMTSPVGRLAAPWR